MATVKVQIKNGAIIAAPAGEKEVQIARDAPNSRKVGFVVTSGTMQVTVATSGTQDAIDGSIAPFANTNWPVYMTIEPGLGQTGDQDQKNIFIKGSGTIVFFW